MARPNFSYEKRQKEIARQKKNEEKLRRKQERKADKDKDDAAQPEGEGVPSDQTVQGQ